MLRRKIDHENHITTKGFLPMGEKEGAGRKVTRPYAALGASLVPDGSEVRGRERYELDEIH